LACPEAFHALELLLDLLGLEVQQEPRGCFRRTLHFRVRPDSQERAADLPARIAAVGKIGRLAKYLCIEGGEDIRLFRPDQDRVEVQHTRTSGRSRLAL